MFFVYLHEDSKYKNGIYACVENKTIPQLIKYSPENTACCCWEKCLTPDTAPPNPFTWPTTLTNLPAVDFPGCQRGQGSSNEKLRAVNLYSPCFPYRSKRKHCRPKLLLSSHLCPLLFFTSSHPIHPRPCRFTGNFQSSRLDYCMRRIRSLCWLQGSRKNSTFTHYIVNTIKKKSTSKSCF